MRIEPDSSFGLIGDVHAEDARLGTALAYLREQGVSRILCTGDLCDGPGSVVRCCELLSAYRVHTVRGNHDRWLLDGELRTLPHATRKEDLSAEALAYLRALPLQLNFATVLGTMRLCHGIDDNDMAKVGPDDFGYALQVNDDLQRLICDPQVQLLANGHSHRAMVRAFAGLTIVNAGSLSGPQAGFLLVHPGLVRVDMFEWHEQTIRMARSMSVQLR